MSTRRAHEGEKSSIRFLLLVVYSLAIAMPAMGADPPLLKPSQLRLDPSLNVERALLQAKYGSRFLCEIKREKTIKIWTTVISMLGMTGGYVIGSVYGDDIAAMDTLGLAAGFVVGWGAGHLIGTKIASDCTLLEWDQASIEKMKRYRIAERRYEVCTKKRNRIKLKYGLAGTLVGAVLGGVAVYGMTDRDGGDETAGLALLLGVAGGGVLGNWVGRTIGALKAPDCGKPPRPLDFDILTGQPQVP